MEEARKDYSAKADNCSSSTNVGGIKAEKAMTVRWKKKSHRNDIIDSEVSEKA